MLVLDCFVYSSIAYLHWSGANEELISLHYNCVSQMMGAFYWLAQMAHEQQARNRPGSLFKSHHPLAHKVTVARTLLNRAEKICTDVPDTDKEKKLLQRPSKTTGTPEDWLSKIGHLYTSQPPPPEQDAPTATVTLPYIRHLSETIRRILAPLRIHTVLGHTVP